MLSVVYCNHVCCEAINASSNEEVLLSVLCRSGLYLVLGEKCTILSMHVQLQFGSCFYRFYNNCIDIMYVENDVVSVAHFEVNGRQPVWSVYSLPGCDSMAM